MKIPKIEVVGKRCKMSKSKGNVVLPEEVVHGVCGLASNFEFRDLWGRLIDWKVLGVWFNQEGYHTSTRYGRQPVFLHLIGEPVPPLRCGKVQHPKEQAYWLNLLEQYENVPPKVTE